MRGKGKRKVVHCLTEEQSRKFKENPIILKAAIVEKIKREKEEELKQKEEQQPKIL